MTTAPARPYPLVIGLTGAKGSGKDTACRIIMDEYAIEGHPAPIRVAFADKMKDFALRLDPLMDTIVEYGVYRTLNEIVTTIGWEGAKQLPAVRKFIQRLGTEAGRATFGEDFWVEQVANDVATYLDSGHPVIFTDVRFPNEIEYVMSLGGEIWRIERPGVDTADPHPSEHAWRALDPNVTIINDGPLEALHAAIAGNLWGSWGSQAFTGTISR